MFTSKFNTLGSVDSVAALQDAHRLPRRTWLVQAGALTLAACGGGGSEAPDAPPAPVCLSTLVPAYFYKAAPWAELAAGKQPTVIIANASNGPGTRLDTQYLAWINAARLAGHRVKGYVYSGYGQRAISAVLADMAAWTQFYGVSDYFIDEASSTTAGLPYYRDLLTAAAAVQSGRRFMLNPGMAPAIAYFGLLPHLEILVFENAWSTYTSTSLPATLDAVASQCWLMALSASEADMLQAAAVARNRRFAGFFATNLPFTAGLPSYWAQETALAVCV